ncbi:hypothetical protein [Nonomuraea sediminis]|uniref:hypothetical protein n=1 Tax=Nonomuraea sediminis TaxID=2835864 RepID=UPI001BDD8A14|nr:hypothetical protein [Nonomuraea sediminis]
MTDQLPPTDLALALAKLSEITAVGLAEIKGQIALLLQRADHADWRVDELAKRLDADRGANEQRAAAVEARLDAVERDQVTRSQLAERTRHIIAIVSVIVTVAGVAIALITLLRT